MLLRGFDRGMVDLVQAEMEHKGVNFLFGKIPVKVSKQPNGKLLAEWKGGDKVSSACSILYLKRFSIVFNFSSNKGNLIQFL